MSSERSDSTICRDIIFRDWVDLKGKSLLDDFDNEEGKGLGSLSSKRLSVDLKGKSLLGDFEKVEGEGEGLGSSSSKFCLV
uniref:Uncharacterized protein n=1 Tax=Tanacetum cinerariifolium TaxID=118510 RepID=A0A699JZG2_TANCI|nr:hypothetical protein [Tanacetum cinerariifolium]